MKTRKDLLRRLAREVMKQPDTTFTMARWFHHNERGIGCGSAACAMGLATTMPVFQRMGLVVDRSRRYPAITNDEGHRVDGFDAAAYLFNITVEEAIYLFGPTSYAIKDLTNPAVVAARILKFANDGKTGRKGGWNL